MAPRATAMDMDRDMDTVMDTVMATRTRKKTKLDSSSIMRQRA